MSADKKPLKGWKVWGENGDRCAHCCNGDRCDDPTHYDRRNCPHCLGTGAALWLKEDSAALAAPSQPAARTCDKCRGSGTMTAWVGRGEDVYDVKVDCDQCGGSGAQPAEPVAQAAQQPNVEDWCADRLFCKHDHEAKPSHPAAEQAAASHKQGCDALGGYGHGIGPCSCGAEQAAAEPMFWVRLCSNGLYEGPLHNASIEDVRKKSGAWTPLYLHPPALKSNPDAYIEHHKAGDNLVWTVEKGMRNVTPLYSRPVRELTDDEIDDEAERFDLYDIQDGGRIKRDSLRDCARALLSKATGEGK